MKDDRTFLYSNTYLFAFLISVLGLVASSTSVIAQSQSDISKQIWIDFNPSYLFSPGLELFGDIGTRKEIENDGWWCGLLSGYLLGQDTIF